MKNVRRTILPLVAVGLCFALTACSKPTPPGGATGSKAEKARKEAESLAIASVTEGGNSQAEALPALKVKRPGPWNVFASGPVLPKDGKPAPPPVAPEPVVKLPPTPKAAPRPGGGLLVVHERVVSAWPHATEAEAQQDAIEVARELVEKRLAELDPPVRRKVTANEVRNEFLRESKESPIARAPDPDEKEMLVQIGRSTDGLYVEYDVEVTADKVREFRTQERVAGGLRILGVLTAVALAGLLFLRADEWTRGYLTSWLALGAAALVGGTAAALIFV